MAGTVACHFLSDFYATLQFLPQNQYRPMPAPITLLFWHLSLKPLVQANTIYPKKRLYLLSGDVPVHPETETYL